MMTQTSAEVLALQALSWLVGQEELLPGFFSATGAGPGDLAALAGTPEFLGAVLDFMLQEDEMILRFAADCGIAPELPAQARAHLPGGAGPHWT